MTLHLLSFQPDVGALTRLAARERLLPAGDDLGYAWHAVLSASFGAHAPKQFVYLPAGEHGGGPSGRLLAYSSAPLDDLLVAASMFADPQFSAPLRLADARGKVMPTRFAHGTRVGLQVRVRPVSRSTERRGDDRQGPRGERDIFLRAVDEGDGTARVSRGECYSAWLRDKLHAGGADVARIRLTASRFTRLRTRDRSQGTAVGRVVEGPDAWFKGEIFVSDCERFAELIARGVGRHRAFGFGMLLLAPPGR